MAASSARRGRHLFVPRWRRGPGGRLEVIDIAQGQGWTSLQTIEVPKVEGPFNVELIPGGVVAAAARRVVFFRLGEPR